MKQIIYLVAFLFVLSGCKKEPNSDLAQQTITDVDGNTYSSVKIGIQTWMKENLKTTKYNDGTVIPLVTDNNTWKNLKTPAYCWYKNDAGTYKNVCGALYNWYVTNTGKLCPSGWHVPTAAEWTTLATYLGGDAIAGGKLKESGLLHWVSPNKGASNEFGFSSVPGGVKVTDSRLFVGEGEAGLYWSSTEMNATFALYRQFEFDTSEMLQINEYKITGQSVRCVKD